MPQSVPGKDATAECGGLWTESAVVLENDNLPSSRRLENQFEPHMRLGKPRRSKKRCASSLALSLVNWTTDTSRRRPSATAHFIISEPSPLPRNRSSTRTSFTVSRVAPNRARPGMTVNYLVATTASASSSTTPAPRHRQPATIPPPRTPGAAVPAAPRPRRCPVTDQCLASPQVIAARLRIRFAL